VVGLIANYRPMKRHETFVRAADAIVRKRDDIDFVLVGCDAVPGEPKKAIQQLVASLGIVRRVHFAHADGNVQDFLSILDVGVNCSEGEGLSNAIMEYMAAEIPCVVSNSGGNPDLITDGVNGYTFALGDHYALARKILRLIDDDTARQRFTQNAKEKVRNEMNLEAMVSRFTQFYRSLRSTNGRVAKIRN
jgi:glycosyltransferase involved in cell wall biosynthesis